MQRAGHIGKIVVTPARQASEDTRVEGAFPVDPEGVHLVIGGTSGFGLATAEWLADRGARHLVLASRSGQLAEEASARVEALRRSGVEIKAVALDVTDAGVLQRSVKNLAGRRSLKGIVHAAMVLDDRLIDGMDQEAITKVLQPKMGARSTSRGWPRARGIGASSDYLLLYSLGDNPAGQSRPVQLRRGRAASSRGWPAGPARMDCPRWRSAWGGRSRIPAISPQHLGKYEPEEALCLEPDCLAPCPRRTRSRVRCRGPAATSVPLDRPDRLGHGQA